MRLLKETSRKVLVIENYRGVCDGCQTPIEYNERLILIEIERTEDHGLYVPIDILACPYCCKTVGAINLYNLEVTEEIREGKVKE